MKLQPSDTPLDAFFAPVRRRHPDVDIVVLPPEERTPSGEPVDEERVDATRGLVADTAGRLVEAALGSDAPGARWAFGPDEGTVVATARADSTTTNGFGVLVALRGALEQEGWAARRLAGEVERLSGVKGPLRVQASYAESTGALLLEVRCAPVYVGRTRARELVRS